MVKSYYTGPDIKRMRKIAGFTQHRLSTLASISQSALAKIEGELIAPSYETMMRLITILEDAHTKQKQTILLGDVMQKKIVHASIKMTLRHAITLLERHHVSQLPVITNGSVVGLVTERQLLAALLDGPDIKTVEHVMSDAPPIVPLSTQISLVGLLLKDHAIVLVSNKGQLVGIVSRSDLFSRLL